jgi:two-component system, OmpR family, phosphate regulon sensor histidine kinase PhoR
MNLLTFLKTTSNLELLIFSSLLLVSIWLGYRLYNLKLGILALTEALKQNPIPPTRKLPPACQQDHLGDLARLALNTVTEADLQRAMALGTQKIQSVLLDQVKDALFVVDENQEIRFANQAAINLFGAKEPLGRPLIEVCLNHYIAETAEMAMATGYPIQDRVRMANDSRVFLVESGKIDSSYQIGSGAWLIIQDITEELRTEQIRKDFVANASHELRTPLSIIKGYLWMMRNDPEHTHPVQIMIKHIDRLTRIVEDMLLISRIESPDGSSLQNQTMFDIGDCIWDTLDHLRPISDNQKAKIEVILPEKPDREFFGDRFYWDQIFFNLVENALKQNPSPGLKITVKIEKIGGRFSIKVIDNGVGIPSADLPEIFKRFYRVDKSHAQTIKGTGLGLSIVKRAVEAHHGTITVSSQPREQTCFTISLPGPPAKVPEKTS